MNAKCGRILKKNEYFNNKIGILLTLVSIKSHHSFVAAFVVSTQVSILSSSDIFAIQS